MARRGVVSAALLEVAAEAVRAGGSIGGRSWHWQLDLAVNVGRSVCYYQNSL